MRVGSIFFIAIMNFCLSNTVFAAAEMPPTPAPVPSTSICEGATYKIADFPGFLPELGKKACAVTENLARDNRVIQQDYVVLHTEAKVFLTKYKYLLQQAGWKVRSEVVSPLGDRGNFRALSASHPKGYLLRVSSTQAPQGLLFPFKYLKADAPHTSVKLIMRTTYFKKAPSKTA